MTTTNSIPTKTRCALIGVGHRAHSWLGAITGPHADRAELVGLCDPVRARCDDVNLAYGTHAKAYDDLLTMIGDCKPDMVIVTTPERLHVQHIVAALKAGCDVATEKPLCTSMADARAILDAERSTGKRIFMGFNYRHVPLLTKLKRLINQGAIGKPVSMDLSWYLDYHGHGLSYFRRWHRLMSESGGLLITKGTHHLDVANWLLGDRPVRVFARGSRNFFGPGNNPYQGTRCRDCKHTKECAFYTDVNVNAIDIDKLSQELGYRVKKVRDYDRDYCPFGNDVDIYDTMAVMAQYQNGAVLNYTLTAGAPFEGWNMAINGTAGRIETKITDAKPSPAGNKLFRVLDAKGRIQPSEQMRIVEWPAEYTITVMPLRGQPYEEKLPNILEGHGGGDEKVFNHVFTGGHAADPDGLFARAIDGAYSVSIGDAANQSIRCGQVVAIEL
jgi:hypothetical protein